MLDECYNVGLLDEVIRDPSPKLKVSISESRIFSLNSIHWIARYTSPDRWTEPKLEIMTLQVLVYRLD